MSSEPLVLKVSRLRPDARLPTKAHDSDAGFDLHSVEPQTIQGGTTARVATGIACELPPGWFAQILGRSSLAARGVAVLGGVMDPSYRGEWIVCLWVPAGHVLQVNPGDKVAQFVVHRSHKVLIEEAADLAPSERGARGFGSSGR